MRPKIPEFVSAEISRNSKGTEITGKSGKIGNTGGRKGIGSAGTLHVAKTPVLGTDSYIFPSVIPVFIVVAATNALGDSSTNSNTPIEESASTIRNAMSIKTKTIPNNQVLNFISLANILG
jgi:hypothetical protein